MTRVAWLTDIHLNFVQADACDDFLARIVDAEPDAVLIGGDIAEARDFSLWLRKLDAALERPIYFVLGNHDFYHGSIAAARAHATRLCGELPRLSYLTDGGVFALSERVGLIGHDGWADGRAGDFAGSEVMLNDYALIAEFRPLLRDKPSRGELLARLGDEAATAMERVLPLALAEYREVVLLTHVPPWREACWYNGRPSDDEWAPHFTSQVMGETIARIMAEHPDRRLTVLCGHTHGRGECRPRGNIHVLTGGAEYGFPEVQRVFEF